MKVSVLLRYLWQLIIIDIGLLILMPIICSLHLPDLVGLFYTLFAIWFVCAFILNCLLIGCFFMIAGMSSYFDDKSTLEMYNAYKINHTNFISKINLLLQICSVFVLGYFGFIIPAVLVFFTSIIYYSMIKLCYKATEKNVKERQLLTVY